MTGNPLSPRCDIFCRVVDNHGDIGVCWRLARQLHLEHGWQVRLWLDDLPALKPLAPEHTGIDVQPWSQDFPATTAAQIVIEAFACELPESYVLAMAAMAQKPLWLNLEYLCVEPWGADIHGQPSPHPRLPLTKYFFVPGTLAGTGGLLCEADLLARRAAYQRSHTDEALQVFMFCYENPALPALLDLWAASPKPVHCRVAPGKPATQVAAWLGTDLTPGSIEQRGALRLSALPFVTQQDFDALLWASDLNFVRGEDSFARAQWAALPLVWQIYPQDEDAHHAKLDAFWAAYCQNLPTTAAQALLDFSAIWNGRSSLNGLSTAWSSFNKALPALKQHAPTWQQHLISLNNLADNLAIFYKKL